jgi:zinc protease
MRKVAAIYALVALCVVFFSSQAECLPKVKRTVLQNGLILLVSEEHSLPFLTMQLVIDAGSKDDPKGKEGLAGLTASCLALGAGNRTEKEISEELDFLGASVSADAGKDYSEVSLRVLTKDLRTAFPLFLDIVIRPTFAEGEVRKEASRTLAAIQSLEDQPGEVAEKAFQKVLYQGGPYGHPTEGTKESVPTLTGPMLDDFHRKYYHPNNAILVITGDIDEKTVSQYLVPGFEKWTKQPVPKRAVASTFATKGETIKIDRPLTQANVIIGHAGISRDNPDYYAVLVMNYILGGGGLTSRLAEDIRNKRGLAYAVDSVFEARKYPGSFQMILQTKNASADEAMKAARGDVERMRTEPVSERELTEAKKYLIGSFPQKLSSQARIASFYGQVEYYGLGLDYPERYPSLIGSVGTEDVQRVARTYLHPDAYITVVVANLKEAKVE